MHLGLQPLRRVFNHRQGLHQRAQRQRRLFGLSLALLQLHQPKIVLDVAAQAGQRVLPPLHFQPRLVQLRLCAAHLLPRPVGNNLLLRLAGFHLRQLRLGWFDAILVGLDLAGQVRLLRSQLTHLPGQAIQFGLPLGRAGAPRRGLAHSLVTGRLRLPGQRLLAGHLRLRRCQGRTGRRQRLLQVIRGQRGQRLLRRVDGALAGSLLSLALGQGGLQAVDASGQRAAFLGRLARQVAVPAFGLTLAVQVALHLVERLTAGRGLLFLLHLRAAQLALAVERGLALLFRLAHL